MQSLFDTAAYNSIIERMNKLTPATERGWGKMNVSQMLAHCKAAFSVPLSDKPMPRNMLGLLIGWAFKSKLYNEAPWKKNLPTSPDFIIKDDRDFEKEKRELQDLVNKFYTKGPGAVGKFPHPMFGKFTPEQWGQAMYKHLDHHLQQFGV
jgi:hypothetical protein